MAHDGQNLLRKPGTLARARAQLLASRGQDHLRKRSCGGAQRHWSLRPGRYVGTGAFRQAFGQIDAYLALEQPLDAAGAPYSDTGAVLLEAWEGADPSALIGLPLNLLHRLTTELGWPLLSTPWAEKRSPSAVPERTQ